jgi:hypothetical protein
MEGLKHVFSPWSITESQMHVGISTLKTDDVLYFLLAQAAIQSVPQAGFCYQLRSLLSKELPPQ